MRVLLPSLFLLLSVPCVSHAAAIHDAAMQGDVAAITAALDAGADVNASDGTATPLYLAVFMGHRPAAALLIERKADVNAPTALGLPLMAAMASDKIDLLKLLLDKGADPDSETGGQPALHLAISLACLDCVRALVEAGADVNARAENGKTPIHLAMRAKQRETADYLMSHGVVVPSPAPISTRLASASVENGRAAFMRMCAYCHDADSQGANRAGSNLWNVVGRDRASVANVTYSDVLRGWDGAWTYEDLNRFLLEPMATTPGVSMEVKGVRDETERVDLIAYLRTLSEQPGPLP